MISERRVRVPTPLCVIEEESEELPVAVEDDPEPLVEPDVLPDVEPEVLPEVDPPDEAVVTSTYQMLIPEPVE